MKARNRDVDRTAAHSESRRRGSSFNSFLAGAATVLLLLLGLGGYLLYRAMETGMVSNPFDPEASKSNNPTRDSSSETGVLRSPEGNVEIKPGQFVLPVLGNRAQVELLSVRRLPERPDEVIVEMRISRLGNNFLASDTINVNVTTARNPDSYEFYEAIDSQTPSSSNTVSLLEMRPGQSVDGSVVLNVPATVSTIDIIVENAGEFNEVPIYTGRRSSSSQNDSVIKPTDKAPATPGTTPSASPVPTPGTAPSASPVPTPQASVGIQPGQFVKLAYGNKAQVELLSLKRIQDPQTKNRDLVNLQMRIRRLADKVEDTQILAVGEATARNPDTTETYRAVDAAQHSTGPVALSNIRKDASVDAYVWLRVPEGVKTLNIYMPETAAFNKVPISD